MTFSVLTCVLIVYLVGVKVETTMMPINGACLAAQVQVCFDMDIFIHIPLHIHIRLHISDTPKISLEWLQPEHERSLALWPAPSSATSQYLWMKGRRCVSRQSFTDEHDDNVQLLLGFVTLLISFQYYF
jgi:hypothetical protein